MDEAKNNIETTPGLTNAAELAKAALAKVAELEKNGASVATDSTVKSAVTTPTSKKKKVVIVDATPAEAEMTEAQAKKIVAKFEGKRGRRPAEFYEAQKFLGGAKAEPAPKKAEPVAKKAEPVAKKAEAAEPMTEAEAKKILAKFEGKRGRRPAEFYEAQKLLGVDANKPAPKKEQEVHTVNVTPPKRQPLTKAEAEKILAQFEGKRGRRPAEFYEAQKLLGVEGAAAPKAAPKAKAKAEAKSEASEPMTEAAAKKILAKFEGKRGRRPAEFYEAQKLLGKEEAPEPKKAAKKAAPKAEKPKAEAKSDAAEAMTKAEAEKLVAKYEGKRGRRPAEFYEAQKLLAK